MDTLWKDLGYALRTLRRRPALTTAAIVSLALGIGASTAIFSVVYGVLLSPLPYPQPRDLVMLWHTYAVLDRASVSVPGYLDYRQQSTSFRDMAAVDHGTYNLAGDGDPERLAGARVSASLAATLGVAPSRGRWILPDEDQPGRDRVVVLSDRLWRRRFGADPTIVGRTLRLDGEPYTVIGIMPPHFRFPSWAELWTPIAFTPEQRSEERRNTEYLMVVARLRSRVTPEAAQSQMSALAEAIRSDHPEAYSEDSGWGIVVVPLAEELTGRVRPALVTLWVAVTFVLLVACANVAGLLLARATGRGRELAIRAALGARRLALVRQLLTESVLLALVGGVLGLALATAGLRPLVALGSGLPRLEEIGLQPTILLYALSLSVLTGLLFGLAPALTASRIDLRGAVQEGGGSSSTGPRGHKILGVLVVSEITLALVLLAGAGLVLKSFVRLLDVDPGFRTENVLTAQLSLPRATYPEVGDRAAFFRRLLERVRTLPGVQAAGAVQNLPLSGHDWTSSFEIDEQPASENPWGSFRVVTPGYFQALGIPLVEGRRFSPQDRADAPGVAVVDETAARRYWPEESPIGKRIRYGEEQPWLTVVGVVASVKHLGLSEETRLHVYRPLAQVPLASMTIVVASQNDATALAPTLQAAVAALDSQLPVYNLQTMERVVDESLAEPRLNLFLLAVFAAAALLLATVGIYGVLSYSVSQRIREIGIRMALGASPGDTLRLILRHGLGLTATGLLIGTVAAVGLSRLMSDLLFGVDSNDAGVFVAVTVLLGGVALLAAYLPARRATRVDPVLTLRYE